MEQEAARSHTLLKWLGGVAIGAAAMYLADPDRGKRRRALAKDRMQSLMVRTSGAIDVASRDFGNRVQGLRARATDIVSQRKKRGTVDDAIVAARVRTRIGRVVTHPHAIKLMVYQGRAMLNGPVLAQEKDQLLDAVLAVPGVTSIEDNLQVHDHPEHIASLQGSGRSRQTQAAIMRENWPPALRAMATLGGGALGIYGLTRRTPVSALLAMLGLGMLARSISNQPLMRGAGSWSGKSAIELHKTIHIAASPETVFDFWSKYENFPHFMSHVREARDLGGGRSHWIVSGPAGIPVEWTSAMTDFTRPERLAWASEADAPVQHTGEIRFEPEDSGTRVSLHMAYSPPAGAIGHAVASLFGGNPRQQMNEDLMRMKSFIESGIAPRDAAQPLRQADLRQPEPRQPGASLH